MKKEQSMAFCPHCGGDAFVVSESEVKTVRFLPDGRRAFCREEVLRSEGEGWDCVVCDSCGRDINPRDILAQIDSRRENTAAP